MRKKIHCPYCGGRLTDKMADGRIRRFCLPCDTPIYENPVPASALVVVNQNEEVLLVKRNVEPKAGHWCLPGGFMELGEEPGDSALRELSEETGLKGKVEDLLGVLSSHSEQYGTVLLTGYLVRETQGEPKPGDDASEVGFFPYQSLPELAFDSHERFVRIWYAGYRM